MFAENITETNRCAETALHRAVYWSDVEVAKAVIHAGVDIDAKDEFGLTALHRSEFGNDLKIGKLLIESGARLNIRSGCVYTPKFESALKHAVYHNHHKFAEMLRKKMANI
jgi:serine/threonine-protein phosphatase 6 regulatory ankyrin repeat subunit B